MGMGGFPEKTEAAEDSSSPLLFFSPSLTAPSLTMFMIIEPEPVTASEAEKVRSTLRQCVRDWAIQGKEERDACYSPMLEALEAWFSHVPADQRGSVRALVPGAGLGRLAWEVAKRGETLKLSKQAAMTNRLSWDCV